MQRYELHKSQISDDFVYWFRNGEDIFQAVLRKKSLKMSALYWRVPYIYIYKNSNQYNIHTAEHYIYCRFTWTAWQFCSESVFF